MTHDPGRTNGRPDGEHDLAFHDVRFRYRGMREPAIHGLTWSVPALGIVGVLGPNGSGKSTLLKLTAGVLAPDAGRLTLGAADLARLGPRARARAFALVPQQTVLEFDYRVRDVVAMGRAPHQDWFGRETDDDRAAIAHALEATDLEALAERSFSTLSGGERQRVAVARALAQQTPWLLLDEPAAHLDLKHREELFRLLERLRDGCRLSALFVTHEPAHAERLCSRVLMLKRGTAAYSGDVSGLRSHVSDVFELESV